MKWNRSLVFALAAAVWIPLAPSARGGEKKDEKKYESTAEKAAAPVNFNLELGLSFASLGDLDHRISVARRDPDPIRLANAANELAAAEKVAGKKASVTAEALAMEAAELAKFRFDAKELQAVALLTGNKELSDLSKRAAKHAAEQKAAEERGEKTRGIRGNLYVRNDNKFFAVRVYVDGSQVGTVPPRQTRSFFVGQTAWETTRLTASDASGDFWSRNVVSPPLGADYWWVLRPYAGK